MNNPPRTQALFVAEKPSIAKTLADVLSGGRARFRAGRSQYNPNYDFELDLQNEVAPPLVGRALSVTVTSVTGHLVSHDFHSRCRDWRTTNMAELFVAEILTGVEEGKEKLAENLQFEGHRARLLVIWTDCDREGEAIGMEVVERCRANNLGLVVKRAQFSAANPADLFRAINALREIDMRLVHAVAARTEVDLRLGAVFTRFQTMMLQDSVPNLKKTVISFGPCQFPTLGFVVARYEAIRAFVSERFWSLRMAYTAAIANQHAGGQEEEHENLNNNNNQNAMMFHFNWARNRLYDEASADVIYRLCRMACDDEGEGAATVVEVTRKPTSKLRPIPLSTVELQVRASKWCRLPSDLVMKAAEQLYQRGIISYPRTETEIFNDSFDLLTLIGEHRTSPIYGAYASRLLDNGGFQPPRRGSKNDEAHPPIHPTKCIDPNTLQEDCERKVYDLVVRHFLACCSKDAVGAESVVTCRLASESFSVKGLIVHERNFLDIYTFERWGERALPDLREGDRFNPTKVELVEGATTPPELLSEADLIRLMDKNGVGTDATIQEHISTILEREYVKKLPERQNRFTPTPLGLQLIRAYIEMGYDYAFSKPNLRAEMEKDLVRICRGEKTKDEVVNSVVTKYKAIFADVVRKKQTLVQSISSVFLNDLDGGMGGDGEDGGAGDFSELVTPSISACGTCGRALSLRRNPATGKRALLCPNPDCLAPKKRFTNLPSRGDFLPHPDHFKCPICRYEVLQVVNQQQQQQQQPGGGGGGAYFFCPSCYSDPPTQFESNASEGSANPGEDVVDGLVDLEAVGYTACMPCFKCRKTDCALSNAEASLNLTPCPECRRDFLVLKRTKDGRSKFISCRDAACRGSVRLPRCVKEVSVTVPAQTCERCRLDRNVNSRLLNLKLSSKDVPPGTMTDLNECPVWSCRSHSSDFKSILEMEGIPTSASTSAIVGSNNNNNAPQQFNQHARGGANLPPRSSGPRGPLPPPPSFNTSVFPRTAPSTTTTSVGPRPPPASSTLPECFKCGGKGHYASNCPGVANSGAQRAPPSFVSSYSQQPPQPFPAPPPQRYPPLPQQPPSFNSAPRASFPNSAAPPSAKGAVVGNCFKCKQPGHWSNQCPSAAAAGPAAGGNGPYAGNQNRFPTTTNGAFAQANTGFNARGHTNNHNRHDATTSQAAPSSKPLRACPNCGAPVPPRKRKCEACQSQIPPQRPAASSSSGGGRGGRRSTHQEDIPEVQYFFCSMGDDWI